MTKKELREMVGEAVGKASMCWEPKPSSQVFDSTSASKVVDEIMDAIEKTAAASFLDEIEKIANTTKDPALIGFMKLSAMEKEAIVKKLLDAGSAAKNAVTDKVKKLHDKANDATIKAYVKSPEPVQKGIQKTMWFMRDASDHSPGLAAGSVFKSIFGG